MNRSVAAAVCALALVSSAQADPIGEVDTVFKFIGQWNNLLWPLVISNSDATRTASVGLQVFQDTNGTQWNLLLMAATVTTIPLIVLFFLTQRWFVRGITMSGLGGR